MSENNYQKECFCFIDREYDPDKHCGVEADDGKPCTRSLTCKVILIPYDVP